MTTNALRWLVAAGTVAAGLVAAGPAGFAADFLRGDANSDGKVTISDSHFMQNHLFRGGMPSTCPQTQDVNADGKLNVTDGILVLNYLFLGGDPPVAPFPEPGAGAGSTDVPCDAYALAPSLEDPAARLAIAEAVAPGGDDALATVTISVASSTDLAGFFASFLVDTGVVGTVDPEGEWLVETSRDRFIHAGLKDSKVTLGCTTTFVGIDRIPASAGLDVFRVTLCLQGGTPAGEYPLRLVGAELIDFWTGRAIAPETVSGTLVVLEDVTAEGCGPIDPGSAYCTPPVAPGPSEINAVFELAGARGTPGVEVSVPFSIYCDAPVQGYSVSVDFDEGVLECLGGEALFEKPDRSDYGFLTFIHDSEDATPGGEGVDEGYFVAAAVFSFTDACNNLPAGRKTPAAALRFRVRPETSAATTDVRFVDGASPNGMPIRNALTASGVTYVPETANTFVLVNGLVDVVAEISIFIRGDSDGDHAVDISDAQRTLAFLFLGGEPPWCWDAADSNDDGKIDIGDPIAALGHLFLGAPALPEPFPDEGADPTDDPMTCSSNPDWD